MKTVIFFLLVIGSFAAKAQVDTFNYVAVYRDTISVTGRIVLRTEGFRTQASMEAFLNDNVDSDALIMAFNVKTKKQLTSTVTTQTVETVITERKRKWTVK